MSPIHSVTQCLNSNPESKPMLRQTFGIIAFISITVTTASPEEQAASRAEQRKENNYPSIGDIEALFAIDELGGNWMSLITEGLKSSDERSKIGALKAAAIHAGKLSDRVVKEVLTTCKSIIARTPEGSAGIEYALAAATLQEIYYSRTIISPAQFVVEQAIYLETVQQALRAAVITPEIGEVFAFLLEAVKEDLSLLQCLPDVTLVLEKAETNVKASLISVLAAQIVVFRGAYVGQKILEWSREHSSLMKRLHGEFETAASTSEIRNALRALQTHFLSKGIE